MIAIVDYGMGNLRSVQKALQHVGYQAGVIDDPDALSQYDRIILPGVGNFADGMRQIEQRGLIEPIKAFARIGRPVLGICLGMQLMLDSSTEDAPGDDQPIAGLGLIPGQVVRFNEDQGKDKSRLKVPHMGWNALSFVGNGSTPAIFNGLNTGDYVYFVHGYYCRPADEGDTAALTDYGRPFASAIHRDNLWATQFHPEKSQQVGLRILQNFAGVS
jgi:glutamine amidotransferase